MKLHRHYIMLHSRFGGAEAETTLEEIGRLLDCTPRNAANLVRAMTRNGWISWAAERGRGRRSSIAFLAPAEEIAAQAMRRAIERKDVARAIGQIQIRSHRQSTALQEHLQGWLLTYFGHHAETRNDRQIDTLRLPIRLPLHTVDPLYMNLLAESFVASHVFDGLVRRSDESGGIAPSIAHAWETNEARTEWTFYLRKEVLFHHGRLLSADDVVYTFERLVRSPRRTLYSFVYKQIRSVRALNPTVVRFELEEPNELFLPFLCTSRAAVVPKDLGRLGSYRFGTEPVGTGPFKVTLMNESICAMEAFGPYFQGRAHLDRVEIVHVPWAANDGSGGGGSAEALSPFHVIPNASAEDAGWSRIQSETTVRKFFTCNTKKTGPLADPSVRERLFRCLDGLDGLDGSDVVGESTESTFESSPVALRLSTIAPYRADAEALAARLERGGFACEVLAVSPEDFKGSVRLEADLILFSLMRDRDEQLRLYDLYTTIAEHVDPHTRIDIETALQRILREADGEARARALGKIERLLFQERQLYVLSEKPLPTSYLPSLRGVAFTSQGWVDLRTVWFPPSI